jgi:hypothetical protein
LKSASQARRKRLAPNKAPVAAKAGAAKAGAGKGASKSDKK